MTARPDITKPENMLEVQGDRVIVYKHEGDALVMQYVLTLVRVVGIGHPEMRMVNKESKTWHPDWAFTQAWYDRLRPAGKNKLNAKWEVTVKAKLKSRGSAQVP